MNVIIERMSIYTQSISIGHQIAPITASLHAIRQ